MTDLLTDTETWGLAVGVVIPLLIAVVQQPHWSTQARTVVGWVCALIAGLITCLANGTLNDSPTVVRTCLIVLIAAQGILRGWQGLGVTPAIERATSPREPGMKSL